jgi:uncharacterized membrane protein
MVWGQTLTSVVGALRLATEAMGALWVAVGFVHTTTSLVSAQVRGRTESFTPSRLLFSRYLSLALEFQLASDILSTSIAPSWPELGKLAVTAVIRTGLNYFLSREIEEFRRPEANPARGLGLPAILELRE